MATDAEFNARIARAVERGEPQPPGYFFDTEEALLDTLTGNRWALLKALAGAGPLGVRELARRLGRDVRAVHADAQRLAGIGLIDKLPDGKLHFPYDAVRRDRLAGGGVGHSIVCASPPTLFLGWSRHFRRCMVVVNN